MSLDLSPSVPPNTGGMELAWTKVAAMILLALSSFLVGIIPIKLMRWKQGNQPLLVSLLLSFGGGVLLFTTFMHLQPEVREVCEELYSDGLIPEFIIDWNINLPELIFCAGFFFVYLVEEVVHLCLDRRHGEDDEEMVLHRTLSLRKCSRGPPDVQGSGPGSGGGIIPRVNPHRGQNGITTPTSSTQVLLRDTIPTISYKAEKSDLKGSLSAEDSGSGSSVPTVRGASGTGEEVAKSVRGLLAVIALSFHAVFEGLAVGLERSPSTVWTLTAALATHKLVIVFCIGVELVGSRTRLPLILLYLAGFSSVTPLGIGLGLALSSAASPSLALASLVLQGMAAGTLLYVVFFEVLQREKSHGGFFQLLAILLGFAVMFALQIAMGHRHSHGEDHSGHTHTHGDHMNESNFR